MNLHLAGITPNENRSNPLYVSDDCQNLLKMWEEYYPQTGYNPPWIGYFIKSGDVIVGSCALTRSGDAKQAEISYWTFKQHESKGIGKWACQQLVELAQKTEPSIRIVAKTAPEKNASTKILERNGFVYKEVVQDHEIGDAWLWVYDSYK